MNDSTTYTGWIEPTSTYPYSDRTGVIENGYYTHDRTNLMGIVSDLSDCGEPKKKKDPNNPIRKRKSKNSKPWSKF